MALYGTTNVIGKLSQFFQNYGILNDSDICAVMLLFVCALTNEPLDGFYLNLHRYLSGTAKNLLDFGGVGLIFKVTWVIYNCEKRLVGTLSS